MRVLLVVLVLVLVVTGGKQSQLLVRLTVTGMDLDWSLTKECQSWSRSRHWDFEHSSLCLIFAIETQRS